MNRKEHRPILVKACTIPLAILITAAVNLPTRAAQTPAPDKIKIFDNTPKTIIVNGYSTSFQWPALLQKKLDRHFNGKRILTVVPATRGGTPIAKWMDIDSGAPLEPWQKILRPKLQQASDKPVIVLAQQSLQWVFGPRTEGIRNADDTQRIKQGADAIEKYATLLKQDGADLVFIAMHIYKHPMEPEIGNERLALAELLKRNIPGLAAGPDLWTPTKQRYPVVFARDGVHPNALGAEIMAQKWFETLLKYDAPKPTRQATRRQQNPRQRPAQALPDNVTVTRDIEYIQGGHERHKLDLYLPKQANDPEPLPLIIWVHGGGWQAGSKDRTRATRLLSRGYAVAGINYRLSQHAIFPAQIQDCKAAVRWLRANAKKHNIDPTRFGVWGSSAGGHLVALLGTTGDVKHFDVGENLDTSSRVQAVCDFFGPTDFTKMSSFFSAMDHDSPNSPESKLVGGPIQDNKDKCRAADPTTYVTKDDPPFLICHGDKDPLVPHNQSEILYEALKKAKVQAMLHTVKGGGHGFRDAEVDKLVDEFFDKHLKTAKRTPR